MNRRKKLSMLLWVLSIMAPVGVYAQQAITHGGKKPQANQQQPPKKSGKSREAILKDLCNDMVYVEGGDFLMGDSSRYFRNKDDGDFKAEYTLQFVKVSSFYIGRYEVTQEEWKAVMGTNPSYFKGAKRPVEQVSWFDCQTFIKKLNTITGMKFRLPKEAEWEYAASGGLKSKGYNYAGSNNLNDVTWTFKNSGCKTHVVGQKLPNELRLYDMCGNVSEWCQDTYGGWISEGKHVSGRAVRGGSWLHWPHYVINRESWTPDTRNKDIGLRLVLDRKD